MLDVNLIRTKVLLIAEAGPLAEASIRQICAEAERYGKECAEHATKGTLFDIAASPGIPCDSALIVDRGQILGIIRGIRADLASARR